jgi:hypothetical protein
MRLPIRILTAALLRTGVVEMAGRALLRLGAVLLPDQGSEALLSRRAG